VLLAEEECYQLDVIALDLADGHITPDLGMTRAAEIISRGVTDLASALGWLKSRKPKGWA
jgi:hypothetical protein